MDNSSESIPDSEFEGRLGGTKPRKRTKVQPKARWETLSSVILEGGTNYTKWSHSTVENFEFNNLNNMLLGDWTCPTPLCEGAKRREISAYNIEKAEWEKANRRACAILRSTVEDHLKDRIQKIQNANEIWETLKKTCVVEPAYTLEVAHEELMNATLANSNGLQHFFNRLRTVSNQAKELGNDFVLAEAWLILTFLDRLGPQFSDFVTLFKMRNDMSGHGCWPAPNLDEAFGQALCYARQHSIDVTSAFTTSATVSTDQTPANGCNVNLNSIAGTTTAANAVTTTSTPPAATNGAAAVPTRTSILTAPRAHRSRFSKRYKGRKLHCSNCHGVGHTVIACWRLGHSRAEAQAGHQHEAVRRHRQADEWLNQSNFTQPANTEHLAQDSPSSDKENEILRYIRGETFDASSMIAGPSSRPLFASDMAL